MASVTELEREVEKTRQYLHKLEGKLAQVRYKGVGRVRHETEKQRLQLVESEFRKKYPNHTLSPNALSIAGILPYASRAHDRRSLRQALVEKYG